MNGDALKAFFQRKFIHNSNSFSTKRECLEMNKMEPARNINLPPTLSKTATATTSVSSFIFLSPITIFQSHSWFAWSCLPQSSQRWSQIKAQHSMWLHNSCSRTARERRALRKDRVWCACTNGRCYGHWRAPVCVQLAKGQDEGFSAPRLRTKVFSHGQLRSESGWRSRHFHNPSVGMPVAFTFSTLGWEAVVYHILEFSSL